MKHWKANVELHFTGDSEKEAIEQLQKALDYITYYVKEETNLAFYIRPTTATFITDQP
jgi:hypothetical protein